MRKILIIAFCLLLPVSVFAQESNRVAAIVGSEIITEMDLQKAMDRVQAQIDAGRIPSGQVPGPRELRNIVLSELIEDMVFEAVLEREGVNISEEAVDQQINSMIARGRLSEEAFAAELSLRGMSMQEYRAEMRLEILKRKLIERVVTNRVVISDEQVMAYYRNNAGQLNKGEIHLYAIFLPVPADAQTRAQMEQSVQKLHKALLQGEDFHKLAMEVSRGPGAAQGGDLGVVKVTDMVAGMRSAVQDLKPGQISQPVTLGDNYVIFKRSPDDNNKPPANIGATPTPEEMAQIRNTLEKETVEQRFQEWMRQLRDSVYVKIMDQP